MEKRECDGQTDVQATEINARPMYKFPPLRREGANLA